MHPLVGRHLWCRVAIACVRRPALGPLGQREDEDRTEPSRQQRQQADAQAPALLTGVRVLAEQALPVGDVPLLGIGEAQQDLPLLAVASGSQVAVDRRLRPLVAQPPTPPANGIRVGAGRGHWLILSPSRCRA
jgi:hypothetical protein